MSPAVRTSGFRPLTRLVAVLGLATIGLAACGDDDPPTGVQGDFSFAISPATLTLEQGQSQTVTATLTRTGGFSGAVSATAAGVPAGVTITPLAIDSAASSATATVTAGATVVPGVYPIAISALAAGLSAKVDTVELTITAAAMPMFTTTLTPDSLTIEQGDSASFSVAVERGGGFAGAITGVVSGLPDSVTATALSIDAAAASGTVTVSTAVAAAAGDYSLVLTSSGAGATDQVDTVRLTITALPVPDLAVALTPDSLNLVPGGQGVSTLAINRSGGFDGDVTLALQDSAPAGVTVTLPAAPVAGDSAVVTVAVGATTAPGTYALTVAASGTGVPTRTAVLTLVVPNLGSFSLAAQPASATVTRGDSATVNVVITRVAPFTAPVTLAVTGLPTGVTAVVTTNPVAGDSATIRLSAAGDAALGGATLSVTGTGGGVSSAPLSVPLTVTASGGGGAGNVTYTFCVDDAQPAFVAYQDGAGAWVRATESPANTYSFNIASGKGGVTVVTPSAGDTDTDVEYGTVAELNQFGDQSCTTTATGRSYTGTVAGTGLTDFVSIVAGGATAAVVGGGTTYSLQNVSNDPFDLLASSFTAADSVNGRVIIRRNIDAPSGTEFPVLDFSSTEAFQPSSSTVAIANAAGEETSVFSSYLLRGGAIGGVFYREFQPSTAVSRLWYGIPTDRQAATDLHLVGVSSFVSGDTQPTRSRNVLYVLRTLQPLNAVMPAQLTAPVFTTAEAGGNLVVQGGYAVQPDYGSFWSLNYSQEGAAPVDATVTVTRGYANGATTVNLNLPDLTALTGWDSAWGLKPATQAAWVFSASGFSDGFGTAPGGFVDGAVSRTASLSGNLLMQAR